MRLTIIIFLTFMTTLLFGQIERSIFQAYDVTDITQIKINLSDSVHIETWPGDNILVESNIAFFNGTKSILEQLIKAGRYALTELRTTESITLTSSPKTEENIPSTNGDACYEVIEHTIYLPESYVLTNGTYVKTEETEE